MISIILTMNIQPDVLTGVLVNVLSIPNQNMIDINNYATKLKNPILNSTTKIQSDAAIHSYNELYHTFTLPVVGDYSHNFTLQSDYILKGYNGQFIAVDCVNNYIESVTLSLHNRSKTLSHIDVFQSIDKLNTLTMRDKSVTKLDFLNLPLLTKCMDDGVFLINIKFKQVPPTNYCLIYDVMFTDDPTYAEILNKEQFRVYYMSQQSQKTSRQVILVYDKGKISIN